MVRGVQEQEAWLKDSINQGAEKLPLAWNPAQIITQYWQLGRIMEERRMM